MKEYVIIVRTDSYAGNFERELCAHLTGIVGECEVGEEYADESIESIFEDTVAHIPDDNGCRRPVSLGGCTKTAGFNGNDVVIWLNGLPSTEQQELIKERALTFNKAAAEHNQWHKKDINIDSIILREIEVTITTNDHVL